MSITVRGPDGAVVTFPAGTPNSVIEREMARHYGHAPEQERNRRAAAVSLSNPKDKRSLGERLGDVFSNTWNTGFIAEGWRAGQDDTADYIELSQQGQAREAIAVSDRFTLNPVRVISRLAHSGGILTDGWNDTQNTRRASDAAVAQERERRQAFGQASRDDPFWEAEGGIVGKTLHGGAALLGTLGGTAVDPTSYITGGSSIWIKAGVQGLVAGSTDLLAQSDSTSAGVQNRIDLSQTALSATAGFAFTGALEGVGSLVRRVREPRPSTVELDQAMRDELDLSDSVNLPALTLDDWTFRPAAPQGPVSAISLPARIDQPRAKGPSLEDLEAEAGRAEAGAKADADERWNGVDWGLAGSPERAKAAVAHLDSLKKFVKPEQVDQFVRWLGRQGDEITEGSSHWNPDVFDFDKLVNDPDQFEELANVMGQIFKPLYDEAGDAARSWKSVQDRQQTLGIATSDAVKAHADITSNFGVSSKIHALETIAMQHVDHLVTKVSAIRTKMTNGTATANDISDLAAHLQATSMFDAMAGGAKSEVARALNIMKATKHRARVFNDIQDSIDSLNDALGGGAKNNDDMAAALDALLKANKKNGAKGFKDEVRKMRAMGLADYASYYIVMGYLSTPATAVRNAVGSVLHAGLSVGERYVAAGVTSPLRRAINGSKASAEAVTFREANAYVAGIYQSFADASRAGFQAFKQAAPVRDQETSIGDAALNQPFLINAERKARWKANPVLSIPDMAGAAIFSTLRTLGHRPSIAMDEFAKAMTYRMQLNALSVREASYRSARLKGADATKEFTRVMDAVANRPTSAAVYRAKSVFELAGEQFDSARNYSTDPTLHQAADVLASVDLHAMADDYARLMTFQNSGPVLKKWEKALGQHRLFKALFVPFLRTPINLVRAGMFDRNPALFALLGDNRAKFANYTAAMRGLDQSLERGGAEADLAMARLVTGIGFMSTAGLLFANGDLVGKRSTGQEEDGVKSYSIRIGGRWFQYQQLSPVAEMLGIVADMMQTFKNHDINDDDMLSGIGGGVLAAIVNNIVNKAALQGVGDFWDLIDPSFTAGDTDRGARAGKELAKKVGSSVVPAFVRNFAHTQDPVMREANGLLEYIQANIPTLSQALPERRDWLGLSMIRKDKDGGFFEGMVQPTRVSEQVSDLVRLEVSALSQEDPDLRMATRPSARFNEQKITPREHGAVLEYQGQVFTDPITGQNMHEALAALLQSPAYAQMPDPQRAASIKDVVSRHRRLANVAIRSGSVPELREMVNRTGGAKANERAVQEGWDTSQTEANARRYGVSAGDIAAIMNFQPEN
jgi:hypothetical protein